MAHLGKARGGRGADALGGAVRADQRGKARFDRAVALPQLVIFRIGDLRRVFGVVELIVMRDLAGEFLQLGLRFGLGKLSDRLSGGFAGTRRFGRAHAFAPAMRLAAAARASAVTALPESIRAISSRRALGSSSSTRVRLRFL